MTSPRLSGPPPLPIHSSTQHHDSWDCMLPGPPSRNNFGSADISPSGLLAFPSGSSVSIVDSRSMQLITAIPMPPPSTTATSLSPFVTSVRWTPLPLHRDLLSTEPSTSHLHLAAADRQGRIALLDFRLKSPTIWFDTSDYKYGVQDLCWVRSGPDSYLLAAIHGASALSLYSVTTARCVWKYDASPEYLSCIRYDPFDSRHFCVIGLKGFLLSVQVLGEKESDVVIKELRIGTDCTELLKLERDAASGSSSPASAMFPLYNAKFAFSPKWRHILFVTFPRELVVFDLQYETALFLVPHCLVGVVNSLMCYRIRTVSCSTVLTWMEGSVPGARKEGEQVHVMSAMEELLPSIGTSVPSPSVLAVVICQSDSILQNVAKLCSDVRHSHSPSPDADAEAEAEAEADIVSPFDSYDECHPISSTHLISISDDGKVWNWLVTAEDTQTDDACVSMSTDVGGVPTSDSNTDQIVSSTNSLASEAGKQLDHANTSCGRPPSGLSELDLSFKISLVGQLQLLSSAVTMLAVPSPSLIATLARGGNYPAVAVPLVALGTQSGTIDVIDISANSVSSSFSVHNSVVRGLRWLGNSRLVSFSYSQVNEKSGGYLNRLVVTCLRSGFNRTFRVMQKPERAPIRALRASSSGRLSLLRSLALPFTVLEWTLPTVPRPAKERTTMTSDTVSSPTKASLSDTKAQEGNQEETSESFAFALVNGALGVFEVHGRRIRDFRPKWPSSSFVSSDGLITAMAYRLPHVVMGDRSGNIRWWDVTTGHSSSFNTHREGIRRIKFSPVVPGDHSRGRIAVLFYDNTFSIFDLDSQDPLANSILQHQFPGTLVLELDWLPLRTDRKDPLVLCIAGADSSFRLVEIIINEKKHGYGRKTAKERFRPMPICSPLLLPTPHALALRMILQLGVKPSWLKKKPQLVSGVSGGGHDLRSHMIDLPPVGDSVVPEMLLKVLEPYRIEGCILDDARAKLYSKLVHKGSALRFAFAAAIFGESSEALFWLQLPSALSHLMNKLANKSPQRGQSSMSNVDLDEASMLNRITSKGKSMPRTGKKETLGQGQLMAMAFKQEELWESANERIPWHERLDGEEVIQNRVHELVSVGNLEAAVSLLLSTSPESSYFYANALRAVALSSAVSRSLLELAVKVVAANMVRTDRSLSGTHLLCAVGRYQEACSQLQDAGCWTDAATLAATHLKGSDYARVLLRWANHVFHSEHNIWRALILYVAAGALQEALAALRESQQPDTAAMFILACREIHAEFISNLENSDDESDSNALKNKLLKLPGLDPENDDVVAVGEYYGQYQRKLVHLCMDSLPYSD
ncbi:hypothetical protein Csa_019596 [Cucumis sativus]|nr:hypothetical protein Csa_019596 [Cucumis sativus]